MLAPASGRATLITVGSRLSAPATLNTAGNLHYAGTDTHVPPTREVPTGVVHTSHYGADAALWNTKLAHGTAAMPAPGQALKIRLEGCAVAAQGGPPPLTQIHFQSLAPLPGGGARVNLSSQPFDIPICGQGRASDTTVSTYNPINLCVRRGDFVALNEEGGFVEGAYRAGVPYHVIGAVAGSSFDSFIKGSGTQNGSVLSPLDTGAMDGFAVNAHEELMMQVVLGTGRNARYVCPGGSRDAPPRLAPFRVARQTEGVNRHHIVDVAVYCRPAAGCKGTATLSILTDGSNARKQVGSAAFSLPGNKTSHVPIRVSPLLMTRVRRNHGATTAFAAMVGGERFTQTITIRTL
jgi:hypothetical protein